MKTKLVMFCLIIALTCLFIPSVFAASASITGVRTDGMPSGVFDTNMPTISGQFVPLKSSTQYYPSYPKATSYLQFQVTSSGIVYPYLLWEGHSTSVPFTIISTTSTLGGRTDIIQVNLKDLALNGPTGSPAYKFTGDLNIRYRTTLAPWADSNYLTARWLAN